MPSQYQWERTPVITGILWADPRGVLSVHETLSVVITALDKPHESDRLGEPKGDVILVPNPMVEFD
jgi:hypothetical protein